MKAKADIESKGLLILGMHRSGTSALAHVLKLGGADLGSRVLGASAGNEMGHWEDALAVEIHERLLSGFGARWDEPFALPVDWAIGEAARSGAEAIRGYIESDRSKQTLWVAKDPRLSLFARLWREAAGELQVPASAILMLRHPMEVARSLAARDGIALGRGMLLWLDYTLAAAHEAEQSPCVVLEYGQLLTDWRRCIDRFRVLPGGARLVYDAVAQSEVDGILDRALRHHRDAGADELPPVVAEVWETLLGLAQEGTLSAGTSAMLSRLAQPVRELLHPLLDESRVLQRLLWERIGRDEARLVELTASNKALPVLLEELRERIDRQRADQEKILREQEKISRGLETRLREQEKTSLELENKLREQEKTSSELERSQRELEKSREKSQREAAEIRLERDRLLDLANQFEQLKSSRSWRWTRPLRFARRAMTGQLTPGEGSKLRGMARSVVAKAPLLGDTTRSRLIEQSLATPGGQAADLPDATMAHLIRLSSPQVGLPDVFIWSVIDWHFRTQRPQHLASALAEKGHRVFYISNNFVNSPEPGFRVDPIGSDGRLFQIHLHQEHAPAIYFGMPEATQIERLRASLAHLLAWTSTRSSVSLVQHPYWSSLARAVPNARLVYDCMDHHAGFESNASSVLDAERRLVADSDLVIVTSSWLESDVLPHSRATAIIRNAGEFEFFRHEPVKVFHDECERKVIGYYGAIAEWFDIDLVRRVAEAEPDALVLLVGSDTSGAAKALADLPNVRLVGEVPYAQLPFWLHGFDVCLLPFKVIPLTLATNPVKIYEYLSAGKPVVAVDLPEMAQFEGLIEVAGDQDSFVDAVRRVLAVDDQRLLSEVRQTYAAGQTWVHRATALDEALAGIEEPPVSIVVLTHNNLAFTQACLFSIETYTDYSNLEVIVVDNASADGSREWLQQWVAETSSAGQRRKLILNDENLGFSGGNNVGLRAGSGDFLVILNNDTYATPGWLRTLCAHLRSDSEIGMVGPVTNNIGNEAKLDITYVDMVEMIDKAGEYTRRHPGQSFTMHNAAFFCVAMPRRVYELIGDMDEEFGVGFFEDDDYCRRVEAKGFRIACAEDVFVHHHLSASFDKLGSERKREMFERNKKIYERKWGSWQPHAYRGE